MRKFLSFITAVGLIFTLSACAQESTTEKMVGLWGYDNTNHSGTTWTYAYSITKKDKTYEVIKYMALRKNLPEKITLDDFKKLNDRAYSKTFFTKEKEEGVICTPDTYFCLQLVDDTLVSSDESNYKFKRL